MIALTLYSVGSRSQDIGDCTNVVLIVLTHNPAARKVAVCTAEDFALAAGTAPVACLGLRAVWSRSDGRMTEGRFRDQPCTCAKTEGPADHAITRRTDREKSELHESVPKQ